MVKALKSILFPCFLFLFGITNAQDKLEVQSNILKITPLKAVGFLNPAIEFSYERKLSVQHSLQTSFSYMTETWIPTGFTDGLVGVRGTLELKAYEGLKSMQGTYTGFQLSLMRNRYNDNVQLVDINKPAYSDPHRTYGESVTVQKLTADFCIKIGYQKIWRSGFVFDAYFGFGLRFKHVKYQGVDDPLDAQARERVAYFDYSYYTSRLGNNIFFAVPANFKIGYSFL